MPRTHPTAAALDLPLPFLTAWDPSDLPGSSIDPLGFDRGYNLLADKLLPGLTNVASEPRYVSLLCGGAVLGADSTSPTRAEVAERQERILRLERFWALAIVLAAAEEAAQAKGIRGVTFAEAQRAELKRTQRRSTGSDFLLLSRQVQYGVLGIYGNVAHGMRLVDRATLGASNDHGERLGRAFLEATDVPPTVLKAVEDPDREVGLDALRAWGTRADLARQAGRDEASVLGQALRLDRVRARMIEALARHRLEDGESELTRLERIRARLNKNDRDLSEAIETIVAFERCYAIVSLGLERILWRCSGTHSALLGDLAKDEVLVRTSLAVHAASTHLERLLENATTPEFKAELGRLDDVRAFLAAVGKVSGTAAFIEIVLARHAEVQRGKHDRGRRKLPWVEAVEGVATLTVARAAQVRGEPRRVSDIAPHAYRTSTADAFLEAAGERG
jgi:hypothetical protein